MKRFAFVCGAILAMVGVMIGAFGAHGLQSLLIANGRLETFQTAVDYQMYHALGLMILSKTLDNHYSTIFRIAVLCLLFGVVIFSGSLYLLSITGVTWLGAITPIGGILFILGWLASIIGIYNQKPTQ